jgi:hypothetical protein
MEDLLRNLGGDVLVEQGDEDGISEKLSVGKGLPA